MGDRVLIQVVKSSEVSPVAYGHWSGVHAVAVVANLKRRMATRQGDVAYTFARLLQEMTASDPKGNLSFGAWNAPVDAASKPRALTAEDSHGDAGCVVIDVSKGFKVRCFGGYLKTSHFTAAFKEA